MEFIAEIGLNYNGNHTLLHELIRQASLCGADFAKFQLGWRDKPNEINHHTPESIRSILKICDFYSIKPLFSIFHGQALDLLLSETTELDTVKLASRTLSQDLYFCQRIANSFSRVIASTGMIDHQKLDALPFEAELLWCVSQYPPDLKQLSSMPYNFLESNFKGISDHFLGISSSLLAISRGATIVERHFTLDPTNETIRDHQISTSPGEFSTLISIGRHLSSTALHSFEK